MSNTIYVNVSADNSQILTPENNRFKYKLPAPIALPTGTNVACLNSIVNLQGITGASIEIPEEVRETLIFQYYINDTSIMAPTVKLGNGTSSPDLEGKHWRCLQDMTFAANGSVEFGTPVAGGLPATWVYGRGVDFPTENDVGYSEICMPLIKNVATDTNGDQANNYFIPFMGEVEIVIPKGTYSISKIGELISDQINGVEIPEINDKNFVEKQLSTEQWNGFQVNNTTLKGMKGNEQFTRAFWFNWYNNGGVERIAQFAATDVNEEVKPQTLNEDAFQNSIAVAPRFYEAVRQNTIQGYLGTDVPTDYLCDNVIYKGSGKPQFFRAFAYDNLGSFEAVNNYNIWNRGMAVGACDFNLSYDTEKSGFKLDKLHTPRSIMTFDMFGNKMDNPGQEGYFVKRVAGTNDVSRNLERPGTRPPGQPFEMGWVRALSQPMTRTTGIMVVNWAYQTAKKYGSNPDISVYNPNRSNFSADKIANLDKFKKFEEWFDSKEKAKEAWEKTLWYRLGFSYKDIQDPDFMENQYFPDKDDRTKLTFRRNVGFTTNQFIDSSAISNISTMYNGQSFSTSSGSFKPDGARSAIPKDISGIQTFNALDINTPYNMFNNDASRDADKGQTTASYKGSFYTGAVMRPVISTSLPFTASRLPILSRNGFMLVTSDLVEHHDVVKDGAYVGILDMIPKSNLSNQDYVADRNILQHQITNPKVISDITINILNPDMTDIELEPNSNLLLQITFPTPRQTILLGNQEDSLNEQAVLNSTSKIQADSMGVNPSMTTFNTFTIPNDPQKSMLLELQRDDLENQAEIVLARPDIGELDLLEGGGFAEEGLPAELEEFGEAPPPARTDVETQTERGARAEAGSQTQLERRLEREGRGVQTETAPRREAQIQTEPRRGREIQTQTTPRMGRRGDQRVPRREPLTEGMTRREFATQTEREQRRQEERQTQTEQERTERGTQTRRTGEGEEVRFLQPAPDVEPTRPPTPTRKYKYTIIERPKPRPDEEPAAAPPEPKHPKQIEAETRLQRERANRYTHEINLLEAQRAEITQRGISLARGAKPRQVKQRQETIARIDQAIERVKGQLRQFRTPTGERFEPKLQRKSLTLKEEQTKIQREARVGTTREQLAERVVRPLQQQAAQLAEQQRRQRREEGGGAAP